MKYLYQICVIFFILRGCVGWITVGYPNWFYTIISFVTIICWYFAYNKKSTIFTPSFVCFLLALCVVHLIGTRFKFLSMFAYLMEIFLLCTPWFIKKTEQKKLLDNVNHIFFVLICASITLHLLRMVNMLPFNGFVFARNEDLIYENYFLYLYSPIYDIRCCGICTEPGFFSMLLSALLLINGYNLKKTCTKVYLVALLLTLSLGGYIITTICWYLYYTLNKTKVTGVYIIKNFFFITIFLGIYIFFAFIWNDGNNIVKEKIIDRLEYSDERGIKGNNRQNIEAQIIWSQFLRSDNVIWGYGDVEFKKRRSFSDSYDAASFAEFVMHVGIAGTMIYLIALSFSVFPRRKKQFALPVFAMVFLDFIQHGYEIRVSIYILVMLWLDYISRIEPCVLGTKASNTPIKGFVRVKKIIQRKNNKKWTLQ